MKKSLILAIIAVFTAVLTLSSCSKDDEDERYLYEVSEIREEGNCMYFTAVDAQTHGKTCTFLIIANFNSNGICTQAKMTFTLPDNTTAKFYYDETILIVRYFFQETHTTGQDPAKYVTVSGNNVFIDLNEDCVGYVKGYVREQFEMFRNTIREYKAL